MAEVGGVKKGGYPSRPAARPPALPPLPLAYFAEDGGTTSKKRSHQCFELVPDI